MPTARGGASVGTALRRLPVGLLLAAAGAMLTAGAALAADFRGGDRAGVASDEVVRDDLYAAGGTVTVAGTVEGDVVVTGGAVTVSGTVGDNLIVAGGTVTVSGIVKGDVFAAGGTVTISGTVEGDVRVAGGSVTLGATSVVREDLVVAGGTFETERGSSVDGDVLAGTGSSTLAGEVGGDLRASGDEVRLFGTVKGNVEAETPQLSLGPRAQIEGALTYTSRRTLSRDPEAVVRGTITREVPQRRVLFYQGPDSPLLAALDRLAGQLRWFAATALVGLLLTWLLPAATGSVVQGLRGSPWASLGLGLAFLVLYPLVALAVGVLAIVATGWAGLPVLVLPLLPWAGAFLLAAVIVAFLVGTLVLERSRRAAPRGGYALLVGIAILAAVDLIPGVGAIVRLLAILFGMGALMLAGYRFYRRARAAAVA